MHSLIVCIDEMPEFVEDVYESAKLANPFTDYVRESEAGFDSDLADFLSWGDDWGFSSTGVNSATFWWMLKKKIHEAEEDESYYKLKSAVNQDDGVLFRYNGEVMTPPDFVNSLECSGGDLSYKIAGFLDYHF